jgi:hypothetical protein
VHINGKVTHFALNRVFNSLRKAKALPYPEQVLYLDKEWHIGDCECEDPYRFGLPCPHLLSRAILTHTPIAIKYIHPRWQLGQAVIAPSNWQPHFVEGIVLEQKLITESQSELKKIRNTALRIIDLVEGLPEDDTAAVTVQMERLEATISTELERKAML